jgi:hypothetical protein
LGRPKADKSRDSPRNDDRRVGFCRLLSSFRTVCGVTAQPPDGGMRVPAKTDSDAPVQTAANAGAQPPRHPLAQSGPYQCIEHLANIVNRRNCLRLKYQAPSSPNAFVEQFRLGYFVGPAALHVFDDPMKSGFAFNARP